jgi:hypothetical protein
VEKRIAFCAMAADRAESEELKQKARARKALLAFDTLKKSGGTFLGSEVLAVARDLEEAGELERAADAYALAGDGESEVRALTAAGAIERLEERLRATEGAARAERDLELALRTIADLDRTAERRAALERARATLAEREDARVADAARAIRARLLRGPVVDLEIEGESKRFALGDEVSIGRGDATIVIGSRAVSRRHVRFARDASGAAFAEDLDTRNGTMLAGARLAGRIAVGEGLELALGGEVPCVVKPMRDGTRALVIEVAGARHVAPLGPLAVGPWRLGVETAGDDSFVVLRTPEGAPRPILGDFELAARVELCHGDEIRAARGGPVVLEVPAASRAPGDDGTDPLRP